MEPDEPVFLSQGPLGRLRELQKLLSRADIPAEIVAPPGEIPNS